MGGRRCLFISHENDLHAAVIAKLLRDGPGVKVDVMAADAIAGKIGLTFFATPALADTVRAGVHFTDYDLIWARRIRMPQRGTEELGEEGRAFIDSEFRAAFEGMCLIATENQIVVNPIAAERRAESKLWQLNAAQAIGFVVPQTVCSNDPNDIRAAVAKLDGEAVLKKLRGTYHRTPLTLEAEPAILSDDAGLHAAPVVVQARIRAACHYRVQVFLDHIMTFRIESAALDWRPAAASGAIPVQLDPVIERLCLRFRETAGLYYCVLDLIEDSAGQIYFLECNPQGQFLFMEQRTGAPIATAFATMLLRLLDLEELAGTLPKRLPD